MRFCHGMSLEKTMTELFDKRKGKFQNLRKHRETQGQTRIGQSNRMSRPNRRWETTEVLLSKTGMSKQWTFHHRLLYVRTLHHSSFILQQHLHDACVVWASPFATNGRGIPLASYWGYCLLVVDCVLRVLLSGARQPHWLRG